ncbi:pyridoxamine 5'-phosphate oxidase family protein [Phytoactinopolyspora mesophila]|uniref:Pyridoxamine 5'-phosphate oxidase N-terminal domain-containing protein n=1 Tax=Phytoactinopolyspora mesophila TaxID=2650750 RepID=A0A7K3M4X1_9ACTN|nr:pyridoxamine 5'-phosphate oxidase family protein [Phytoactinopolyspora mesophila]NDL58280.1 hypothetical protein [Phytoactinopolyspora mesophila]
MTEQSSWSHLKHSAPDFAARARSIIRQWGFVYAGTIRPDGAPRISPIEAHLVEGHLVLVLIPQSLKALDVARDPRLVLQSPIVNADEPETELKIRGRAYVLPDDELRDSIADAIEDRRGWRPVSWHVATVSLDLVSMMEWRAGDLTLTRWDPRHGLRGPEARRFDPQRGAYVTD